MAFPTIPVLGAAALAYVFRDKIKAMLSPSPKLTPAGYVTELKQNALYAGIAAMFPAGGTDPTVGSNHLKAYLTSVGFDVLTQPSLQSATEAQKFAAGQAAYWIFVAKWTKPGKYVEGPADPAIGAVMFTPLPVA